MISRFFFILFLTGVWFAPAPAPAATEQGAEHYLPGPLPAEVVRVIDGDSVEVRVRVWLDQEVTTTVRLQGLDTAELKSRCVQEHDLAIAAKARLEELLRGQKVELYDIQRDKYGGRVIAKIRTQGEADIAKTLIAENLGRAYEGKKRGSWCERADAE
ncbi:MAG: nuclease [Alphaproteobacteria bacterium]|nr:MAG: nuclease [Alphaproteobacteria bacterium]